MNSTPIEIFEHGILRSHAAGGQGAIERQTAQHRAEQICGSWSSISSVGIGDGFGPAYPWRTTLVAQPERKIARLNYS